MWLLIYWRTSLVDRWNSSLFETQRWRRLKQTYCVTAQQTVIMVLILDGNSRRIILDGNSWRIILDGNSWRIILDGSSWRKVCLFVEKKIPWLTAFDLTNALNRSNKRDCSLRAHQLLSFHDYFIQFSYSFPLSLVSPFIVDVVLHNYIWKENNKDSSVFW